MDWWDVLKSTGLIGVPFLIGKYLWKKAVTDEIQKVGAKADQAAKSADQANVAVQSVPDLVCQLKSDMGESLSKMSNHYAHAIQVTEEARDLNRETRKAVAAMRDNTDLEIKKFQMFGGKFVQRLKKIEEDVEKLKVGKVYIVGDGKKKS
jgi:hydrogenase maturation factor HypF (carbamoyltransferase family)